MNSGSDLPDRPSAFFLTIAWTYLHLLLLSLTAALEGKRWQETPYGSSSKSKLIN